MWENLLRVNWNRLTHAYGWARSVPTILLNMISLDEKTRAAGWDAFWGAVNHQGDFYDSTVAAIPLLTEAVNHPKVPDRASILYYFRHRWLDAPQYGGDPMLAEPPGGIDEPTPMRSDAELAVARQAPLAPLHDHYDEEFDIGSYRRMDLCAWQTGRAIQAGRATFERLLDDPDLAVAAAAAELLLLWPETGSAAKRTLIRTIDGEPDPVQQAQRILELGVYGTSEDLAALVEWTAPQRPAVVRAAAGLACAWIVDPAPLPEPVAEALADASAADADAFGRLPWVGLYHRGPWILPGNAAGLILRLAENRDQQVRWRGVQGLAVGRQSVKHLSAADVVPVLVRRLSDRDEHVRAAAALALAQRGESVLEIDAHAVPALLGALGDADPSACGHAARLLAVASHRLTPAQRKEALAGLDRAVRRFESQQDSYVHFGSLGIRASQFLKEQRGPLQKPIEWNLPELFQQIALPDREDRRLSALDCDRRLASAYARDPKRTIAAAIEAVAKSSDRNTAIGAANWLATLGPAAEPALAALAAMAEGKLDSYAQGQARVASESVRRSLGVTSDSEAAMTLSLDEAAARDQLALLARRIGEKALSGPQLEAIARDLAEFLKHSDAGVRVAAAELLIALPPEVARSSPVAEALGQMLADEGALARSIAGEFEFEGRLYHWRREHRAPRAAAVRALFHSGRIPQDGRVLAAMIGESMRPAIICGGRAAPHRFPIEQWRLAANAAGGRAIADPIIRAARQQCHHQAWSDKDVDRMAGDSERELAEVISQLSGRLVSDR